MVACSFQRRREPDPCRARLELLPHFPPTAVWMRVPGKDRGARGYKIVVAGGAAAGWPLTVPTPQEITRAARQSWLKSWLSAEKKMFSTL
jgi:hypothetical protein